MATFVDRIINANKNASEIHRNKLELKARNVIAVREKFVDYILQGTDELITNAKNNNIKYVNLFNSNKMDTETKGVVKEIIKGFTYHDIHRNKYFQRTIKTYVGEDTASMKTMIENKINDASASVFIYSTETTIIINLVWDVVPLLKSIYETIIDTAEDKILNSPHLISKRKHRFVKLWTPSQDIHNIYKDLNFNIIYNIPFEQDNIVSTLKEKLQTHFEVFNNDEKMVALEEPLNMKVSIMSYCNNNSLFESFSIILALNGIDYNNRKVIV